MKSSRAKPPAPRMMPAVDRVKVSGQPLEGFAQVQRTMAEAIMRPMTSRQTMQSKWVDGRNMQDIAAEFIKPNQQLTSFKRLEIYNRQYWFRLADSLNEDFPGLCMILGQKRFDILTTEYLVQYPSASYDLRNLGSQLARFIVEQPQLTSPHQNLCRQVAEFEWARIVAFDGEAKPPLAATSLVKFDPNTLQLQLQPYISLCKTDYALDDFLIGLQRTERAHTEAGTTHLPGATRKHVRKPRKEKACIVVHRLDNSVYFKRVSADALALLTALKAGATVHDACRTMLDTANCSKDDPLGLISKVNKWFQVWSELGWFCQVGIW